MCKPRRSRFTCKFGISAELSRAQRAWPLHGTGDEQEAADDDLLGRVSHTSSSRVHRVTRPGCSFTGLHKPCAHMSIGGVAVIRVTRSGRCGDLMNLSQMAVSGRDRGDECILPKHVHRDC
jgi:hypothetical protein